jgi:hypothetical protein
MNAPLPGNTPPTVSKHYDVETLVLKTPDPEPRLYTLAHGKDYRDPNTKTSRGTAAAIVKRFRRFHDIELTQAEYAALGPSEKGAQKKASGYFIGGEFGGFKTRESCQNRSMVTLDLDALTPETAQQCIDRLRADGAHSFVYSTASHTPEKPRLRAVAFLANDVAPDDYRCIVEYYAAMLPPGAVSNESLKVSQIMYMPQRCKDVKEVFEELPGEPLDPAPIIEAARLVPRTERKSKSTPAWDVPGIVGAVGRMFGGDFDRAIAELELPYKRSSVGATCGAGEDRYTFTRGSGADGARWYINDGHLFSDHGSDPCYDQNATIFDALRLHRHNPSQDDSTAPINERASHKACERFFLDKYPALAGELYRPASTDELEDLGPAPQSEAEFPSGRFRVIESEEFAGAEFIEPEWQVHERVPARGIGLEWGKSGTFKSFAVYDLAACIHRGVPWRDRAVKKGRSVIVVAEGEHFYPLRIKAYAQHHGCKVSDLPAVIPCPVNLFEPKQVSELIVELKKLGATYVVFDTLSQCSTGAEENSAKDMNVVIGALKRVSREVGCFATAVHHSGKDESKGARGSSVLKPAVDVEVYHEGDGMRGVSTIEKLKDGPPGAQFPIEMESVALGVSRKTGKGFGSLAVKHVDTPVKRNAADKSAAMRAQFAAWHRKEDFAPFSRTAVTRKACNLRSIWPSGVTEVDAKAFFTTEVSAGMFQPAGDTVKGKEAFTMSRETAERILQEWEPQAAESGSAAQ